MSLEHLPSKIETVLQRIAKEQHIPRDEALLRVIETGIASLRLSSTGAHSTRKERQARKKLVTELRGQRNDGPQAPLRTDNPERVIGLFGDCPEIADSILHVVEERSQRYAESGN